MKLPVLTDLEKKRYATEGAFLIRLGHLINCIAWTLVIAGFTITYYHNPYYLVVFGLPVYFVAGYLALSNVIGFLYKPFSYIAHADTVEQYWTDRTAPSIDIFLPICGEPLEVLHNTWEGVSEVVGGYGGTMTVYVLDDKNSLSARLLAKSFSFSYLNRPNQGEMKKAGNLKYGYQHSQGDFILILDADFRPHPAMVREMVPYMKDEHIAIVQSPQFFDLKGVHGLQYGAGTIQSYFYRIIQRARGGIGGSICVGSCALYRRIALDTVGGTYQIEHSEDVWTGFSLLTKGWKIQYIPIPLSKGLCSSDLHSFFKQQNRWCNGSLSLLTSPLFWKSKVAWYTKVSYFSGFMFYLSSSLILVLPIQNLILLYEPKPMHWYLWLFFLPSVVFTPIFMWIHGYGNMRYGTVLARMTALWSYTYAFLAVFLGKPRKAGHRPVENTPSQTALNVPHC
jgi:cellulose synthase (UDP-forming)